MNFAITTSCDKGCDYCFARESRNNMIRDKEEMNMSFIQFCEFLGKVPRDKNGIGQIKILGGEPTQHPELDRFLDEMKVRGIKATLISNFLFSSEVREVVKKHASLGAINGFLINSTDLDKANRITKFSENYNNIYEFLYPMERENEMSLGITFSLEKDWTYYTDYIKFLRENLTSVERLRLSMPFPGDKEEKNKFPFINNKDAGQKFIMSIKQSIDIGFTNSVDCVIYPCMFNNREEWKFVQRFSEKTRINCSGAPLDIFPDGTASYCYPLKDSIKLDISKYNSLKSVTDDVLERYRIIMQTVDKPSECKGCSFMKSGECHGPCLGQYDLSDIKIGLNV